MRVLVFDISRKKRFVYFSGPKKEFYTLKNSKNVKNRVKTQCFNPEILVGVAGLEPAASWSRTKHATICATPRGCENVLYCVGG